MTSIQKLQDFLPDHHTAALITSQINARYFTLFNYTDGAVLVTKDEAFLLCDSRYIEAAERSAADGVCVVLFKDLYAFLNDIFLQKNIKSVMIEEEVVTLNALKRFKEKLNAELLTDSGLSEKIRSIRIIKTPCELELITKAQRITERALTEVLNFVLPGVSERQISVELEHLIKRYGGERVAFELITIAGANTSLPHGVPTDYTVKQGDFFTFDIGAVYEGYHSDMTRTYAVGYADEKMQKIYDVVYQAQRRAFEKIAAGVSCAEVDRAARDYITEKGYGEYFGHSTGHGVGLEIHEDPAVSTRSQIILQDNMVITDEPGIYLPGEFGVRIEDMIVVSGDSGYTLAEIPKELIIL